MCARRHQRGGCERRGGDKRDRASIERSSGCFLVARIVGRKSTRRDLAIDAARRVAKGRAPRVSGHAPRVCGVCRPCDRRPFRRGVTRIHRRRRRELNATRREPPFFRARARGRHLFSRAEIEVARSRVAPRPNALVPRLARAARTRPRSVPPHARMGLWKSLLVALGLAKKKVRVETGAGTRSPRPRRRRPSLARSSVPDEKRAPDAFP